MIRQMYIITGTRAEEPDNGYELIDVRLLPSNEDKTLSSDYSTRRRIERFKVEIIINHDNGRLQEILMRRVEDIKEVL